MKSLDTSPALDSSPDGANRAAALVSR